MLAFLITTIVGIVLIVLGISNTKGNINSLHSYHRNRVSEKDKPVFGKLMGSGLIICGISIIVSGLLSIIGELTGKPILFTIGTCLMTIGLVTGVGIMIYATTKYNKGIF